MASPTTLLCLLPSRCVLILMDQQSLSDTHTQGESQTSWNMGRISTHWGIRLLPVHEHKYYLMFHDDSLSLWSCLEFCVIFLIWALLYFAISICSLCF